MATRATRFGTGIVIPLALSRWQPYQADILPPQTILDCSETNEGFYVKCGYKRVGLEMAHYYDK